MFTTQECHCLLDLQYVANKGRTIRKVMGGGRGVEKNQKKSCKGKCQEKTICAKKKVKKKIRAEGRSNRDFYLIYKICQCLIEIILIQNILGALPQALLYYY